MNKYQEVKRVLTNIEVVQKYLGLPEKHNSAGIWYKSPFRSEKTASFYVSNKGIHDFGSSEHYDIISFVQRYYNTTPSQALEIVCKDFGLNIGNEYENKKMIDRLKKKREEEKEAQRLLDEWYNNELIEVCTKIQINKKCIEFCNYVPNSQVLKILYDEQSKLEYEFEILINASETEKINMYKEEQDDRRRKESNFRKNRSARAILQTR